MEVLLRSLYGATTVMAVPRRPHCGLAQPAVALRKFWTCSKFPPCQREGPLFWQFLVVLRRSMMEPRRTWRCHCGLRRTSIAVAPHLRCDGGMKIEGRFYFVENVCAHILRFKMRITITSVTHQLSGSILVECVVGPTELSTMWKQDLDWLIDSHN